MKIKAFLSNDLDDQNKIEIKDHLHNCQACSQYLNQLTRLSEILQIWERPEPSPRLMEKIKSRIEEDESRSRRIFTSNFFQKAALRFAEIAAIVVLAFIFAYFLRKPTPVIQDYSTAINLYLTEHQEAVMQTVSQELSTQPTVRISIHRDDILYFEHIDGLSSRARPGIIFRGEEKFSEEFSPSDPHSISKGKVLTLLEAQNEVDYAVVAPARFHPGYILDSIRKIEDFNSLHMVYTNGIDTTSLFEQPLNGDHGLAAQDFREYAIYRSVEPSFEGEKTQDKATILAWTRGALSFVLIGKMDMSQLMDIAQAINTASNAN
ncbi:MAG: hypothetical protein GQ544_06265 [Candidatus Aminicenantes bacterium]|nr:hypothetical protein [Candidatus Aminicenantes bacterium]